MNSAIKAAPPTANRARSTPRRELAGLITTI